MGKTGIPQPPKASLNDENVFSLIFFRKNSVKTGDYNSFYENRLAAIKGLIGFFWILEYISNNNIEKLNYREKRRLHYCKYDPKENDGREAIKRVKDVLSNYGLTQREIEEYEDDYFEITAKGDGARVIFTKYEKKNCPLFIDANHMICLDSCKDPKMKMAYSVPSLLGENNINYFASEEERNLFDNIDTIIECYRDETIKTKEEFLKEYDEIFYKK